MHYYVGEYMNVSVTVRGGKEILRDSCGIIIESLYNKKLMSAFTKPLLIRSRDAFTTNRES